MKKEKGDEYAAVTAALKVPDHLSPRASDQNSTDQTLVRESLELTNTLMNTVVKILPSADSELIGGFFADLLDLWETGQKLDRKLQEFARLQVLPDREQFRELLTWISAIQVDMASYWIDEVKQGIPKLLRELDK